MKDVVVWDLYIRVNHWLMVILFSGLILTGKAEEDYVQWHFYMGYLLSALLLVRLLYGLFGSKAARFISFLKGPVTLYRYTRGLFTGTSSHYLGHNPLGALMVVALLLLSLLQVGSGFVSSDDVFWYGPMYEWVSDDLQEGLADWHRILPDILLALVACHIFAVVVHELAFRERLIKAMLKGKKAIQPDEDYQDKALFDAVAKDAKPVRLRLLVILGLGLLWLYWLWQLPI